MKTVFLRVLEELHDKEAALRAAIENPFGVSGRQRFEVDTSLFPIIPRSPFAYWISDRIRAAFIELSPIEAGGRTAKVGLQTSDDFRFVRAWWAVPPQVQDPRWVPFAKGGQFLPFYADLHLVVNWGNEGKELKAWADPLYDNSGWSRIIKSTELYFRPGLTWPHRTKSELSMRVMPAGSIFGCKGPAIFSSSDNKTDLLSLLAIASSQAFRSFVEIQLAAADAKPGGAAHSFDVGVIQRTPMPNLTPGDCATLTEHSLRAWSLKRKLDTNVETSHAFLMPALAETSGGSLATSASAWAEHVRTVRADVARIQAEIDALCFNLYGIGDADRSAIAEGFSAQMEQPVERAEVDADTDVDSDDDTNPHIYADTVSLAAELVSWAVGVAFGRFDIRLATGARSLPPEPDPFDSLPICSPAMLTGDDGLPLGSPPADYPIPFPDNGIRVDDQGHPRDLTAAVRTVFDAIFNAKADEWWTDVSACLDPKDHELRTWLKSYFFEYHLRCHAMSRRKAPVLWQLTVPSGRYSLWLYAHRLTPDSFFQIQNDVLTPKLAHEESQLTTLVQSGGSPSARERKQIVAQKALLDELRAMLDEVKRVAPLWNPKLDDGVVLTMAPLWRLVSQHNQWQKELKTKWDELAAGKYDWAHIAMHLWPERVVPKCVTDRSLAIAHGLEGLFWVEKPDGKWDQRSTPLRRVDELVRERTSTAVKAALKTFLEAPAASANGNRSRGRRAANSGNGAGEL